MLWYLQWRIKCALKYYSNQYRTIRNKRSQNTTHYYSIKPQRFQNKFSWSYNLHTHHNLYHLVETNLLHLNRFSQGWLTLRYILRIARSWVTGKSDLIIQLLWMSCCRDHDFAIDTGYHFRMDHLVGYAMTTWISTHRKAWISGLM